MSIIKTKKDFDNGDYIEQVTRLSLLLEIKQQINHNILAYSTNYLMNEPKEDFKNDWYLEKEKLKLIEQMIKEEKEKNINKKKDDIER